MNLMIQKVKVLEMFQNLMIQKVKVLKMFQKPPVYYFSRSDVH